jgi:hypothetical protein
VPVRVPIGTDDELTLEQREVLAKVPSQPPVGWPALGSVAHVREHWDGG